MIERLNEINQSILNFKFKLFYRLFRISVKEFSPAELISEALANHLIYI